MQSYWGVDHGVEISKASRLFDDKGKSTTGRKVTAAIFPAYHGAFAGKKGKKLRSAGNEFGGSLAGGVGGRAVGALPGLAARSPGAMLAGGTVGQAAGSATGAVAGNARNERKNYLKKQPKGAW